MSNKNLGETVQNVHDLVQKYVDSGQIDDLDNMTVKELKLKAFGETERILSNDEKASIISVFIVAT